MQANYRDTFINIWFIGENCSIFVYPIGYFGRISVPLPKEGVSSNEEALQIAKQFIDEHQWEEVDKIDPFTIFVRLWWDGKWGYSVRNGGMTNRSGFETRQKAIQAGQECAREEMRKLGREIEQVLRR